MKLYFQQKLLAVAVASALVTPAFAVVDMNNTSNPGTAKFAKEIDYTSTATLSGADLYAKAKYGFNLGSGKFYTVSFKMDNAKFKTSPALSVVTYSSTSAAASCLKIGSASLVDGNKGAIFEIETYSSCVDTGLLLSDTGGSSNYFQISGHTIDLSSQTGVALTYGLYVDPSNATTGGATGRIGDGATASYIDTSGQVVTFSTKDERKQVTTDVTNSNKSFVVSTSTNAGEKYAELCTLDHMFKSAATDPKAKDSTTIGAGILTTTAKDTTLVVTGDFSAASESGAYTSDTAKKRVFLHTSCSTSPVTTDYATSLSQTTATFEIGNAAKNSMKVCYAVNGVSEIQPATYHVQYNPKSATGYSVPSVTADCGAVVKGGTSDSISMALVPGAVYPYFIRVSNPSTTNGLVHLKAYNDKGVAGAKTMDFMLNAGQSTGIINIADVVAATGVPLLTTPNDEAVDGTGKVVGGNANKLRIVADAEFGAAGSTAVKLTGITLSKDGNSFIILAD